VRFEVRELKLMASSGLAATAMHTKFHPKMIDFSN